MPVDEPAEDERDSDSPATAAEPRGTAAQAEPTDSAEPAETTEPTAPVFSGYGIAATVLGLVCVAAIVLAGMVWSAHHERTETLNYQIRMAQAAVDWTGVLINMNKDNIDTSLSRLHDGTVGELNNDFDSVMKPYRDVVLALQSRSSGQINSVSIESVHHDLDRQPGTAPKQEPGPPEFARRTDTVLIVATSVSENAGNNGKPQTVRWNLRLGVSDVDGKLLISRLEPVR